MLATRPVAVKQDDTLVVHAGLLAAITTRGKHRRTLMNITSWADVELLNKVNLKYVRTLVPKGEPAPFPFVLTFACRSTC
jgi:hypothetical protein